MPTAADSDPTGIPPVTARDGRGLPGVVRVCPILRTVLDAHGRDRAEVRLDLLARLAAPLPG